MISDQLLDPNIGLFKLNSKKTSIYPNPDSFIVSNHLMHFRYFGRFVAKSIICKKKIYIF